jgi:hypothetical protein
VVVPRSRYADADWFVTAARALGAAGEPFALSFVIRVMDVQDDMFPDVKSSEKIGGVVPPLTRIDADVPLIELGLFSESIASTRYVWLVPAVSPGSMNVSEVVCPIEVGFPSR